MKWLVEPIENKAMNDIETQAACGLVFGAIGGCLMTILCSDLCFCHCILERK
jgi:hypothetical protein